MDYSTRKGLVLSLTELCQGEMCIRVFEKNCHLLRMPVTAIETSPYIQEVRASFSSLVLVYVRALASAMTTIVLYDHVTISAYPR